MISEDAVSTIVQRVHEHTGGEWGIQPEFVRDFFSRIPATYSNIEQFMDVMQEMCWDEFINRDTATIAGSNFADLGELAVDVMQQLLDDYSCERTRLLEVGCFITQLYIPWLSAGPCLRASPSAPTTSLVLPF